MSRQNSEVKTQELADYSFRITILTLFAYGSGLFVVWELLISISMILVCALLILALNSKGMFYQANSTILSFIGTTYAFGIIHAFTYRQIVQFIDKPKQQQEVWPLFQIYLSFLCIYFYFQFQLNNCFHHIELNWKSFLIYHSKPYLIANLFSLTQHFITKYLFGFGYKNSHYLIYPAIVFMVLGEGLRICAFFTARSNFTHLVRYRKHPKHELITHGVYSFFRHPSYTGYFYFSVSSQILLGNWISAIGFFIVLTRFFNERISDEELMLASFFQNYLYYKKKTYILIPFVKDPSSQQIMKFIIKNAGSPCSHYDD